MATSNPGDDDSKIDMQQFFRRAAKVSVVKETLRLEAEYSLSTAKTKKEFAFASAKMFCCNVLYKILETMDISPENSVEVLGLVESLCETMYTFGKMDATQPEFSLEDNDNQSQV